jgi:quercetin dioxygenase-like cupin family protein
MIRRQGEREAERKRHIRGGVGAGLSVELLSNGEMAGVLSLGRTTLEPGASIGEHAHPDTEDLYLILEGRGTGLLDGERFPVSVGDLFLVKAGGTHGLINDSDGPLTFLGVLTHSNRLQ